MRDGLASVEGGWTLYRPRRRQVKVDSFLKGMSDRLSERIGELAWARRRSPTGSALVPLKEEIIRRAMKDEGIDLGSSRLGRRDVDPAARLAGKLAAEKVRLDPAVERTAAGSGIAGEEDEGEEGDGAAGRDAALIA